MYGKSLPHSSSVICWLSWCRLFGRRYLRTRKGTWSPEINYVAIAKDSVPVEYKITLGIILGVTLLASTYSDLFIRVPNTTNFVFGGRDLSVVPEALKKTRILRQNTYSSWVGSTYCYINLWTKTITFQTCGWDAFAGKWNARLL